MLPDAREQLFRNSIDLQPPKVASEMSKQNGESALQYPQPRLRHVLQSEYWAQPDLIGGGGGGALPPTISQ